MQNTGCHAGHLDTEISGSEYSKKKKDFDTVKISYNLMCFHSS